MKEEEVHLLFSLTKERRGGEGYCSVSSEGWRRRGRDVFSGLTSMTDCYQTRVMLKHT